MVRGVGVGDGEGVPEDDSVADGVIDGVKESDTLGDTPEVIDGVNERLDVTEGVGVAEGVMDADAPNESEAVGVCVGVGVFVGVCVGAAEREKELLVIV